ncbi:nuclear transport factor 2 family protein [Pseudohaliea sp.]|uniref:nuclear transport factor 2 family protein n=1 Tax=Pseudohaliea sp. TaxID=2740289 RepID=UPI0032EEBA15
MTEQIRPPFTRETALAKVQRAEDLWNTRDPATVALAYTEDSRWRNRNEFLRGRGEIEAFLQRKWRREFDYRLRKDLFTFTGNRIAVKFHYEYRDDSGQWFRAFGLEHWTFDDDGLMNNRDASINEVAIREDQRQLFAADDRS